MILYASFRTDLPAFYGEWLYNRLKNYGWFLQPNPMNPKQLQRIESKDIEAIVFCSKNYRPFLPYVKWFNDNFKCLFHYTINAYTYDIEPKNIEFTDSLETILNLSEIVPKKQIIWRYDPILFTSDYNVEFHKSWISTIGMFLSPFTETCIFSFVSTIYPWVKKNIPNLIENDEWKHEILEFINSRTDMHYQTCGHGDTYYKYNNIGISACTGVDILEKVFDVKCNSFKSGHYRPGCGCIPGTNVGQYNTCLHKCKYCYAARSSSPTYLYDIDSPVLLGAVPEDANITPSRAPKVFIENVPKQLEINFE